MHEDCIQQVDAFGRGSVMVWAGIFVGGKTSLTFIDGNLNGRRYIDEVLRPEVIPYAGAVGPNFVLQDDNATPHRARIVTQFLQDEGIERMEWPAMSPDLNPIENLWDQLGRKVAAQLLPNSTLNDLRHYLDLAWTAIPQHKANSEQTHKHYEKTVQRMHCS